MIHVDANLLLYAYQPRAEQKRGNPSLAQPGSRKGSRRGRAALGIVRGLVRDGKAAGPLVMDAVLAALVR
jgi:hypothetical protein